MVALAIVSIGFLPIYTMRRKMRRMSEDDLRNIDLEDWKRQIKSNAYVRLITHNLWGAFSISWLIYNYQTIVTKGIDWSMSLIFAIGIIYIISGFVGYQTELKRIETET